MDTYANAQWTDASQTSLAVDWTTTVNGKPITQRITVNAKPGLIRYDAILAHGLVIASPPVNGLDNYYALIRRRAQALTDADNPVDALILLHTIGE